MWYRRGGGVPSGVASGDPTLCPYCTYLASCAERKLCGGVKIIFHFPCSCAGGGSANNYLFFQPVQGGGAELIFLLLTAQHVSPEKIERFFWQGTSASSSKTAAALLSSNQEIHLAIWARFASPPQSLTYDENLTAPWTWEHNFNYLAVCYAVIARELAQELHAAVWGVQEILNFLCCCAGGGVWNELI